MLANRLRKNLRRLKAWRKREGIECYRLYDADIPEYAVAIDVYGDWVHVAEYVPPPTVDPALAARRMVDVSLAIPAALDVAPAQIMVKQRARQRGRQQYQKQSAGGRWHEVREGQARLLVNLTDYVDTGLFLDHRRTRLQIAQLAAGRRFLNLFCYTATASIHAALGGASSTTGVDLSRTYLNWARRNFDLNRLPRERHHLVRADCLTWLRECRDTYGLIFLDPPTFSNSKRTELTFDVQRDHPALIRSAMARLEPGGRLIFSTSRRRFHLDPAIADEFALQDITRRTLDHDFPWPSQGPPAHQCFGVGPS